MELERYYDQLQTTNDTRDCDQLFFQEGEQNKVLIPRHKSIEGKSVAPTRVGSSSDELVASVSYYQKHRYTFFSNKKMSQEEERVILGVIQSE